MSYKILLVIVMSAGIAGLSSGFKKTASPVEKLFHDQVSALVNELEHFNTAIQQHADVSLLKKHFILSRNAFKRSSILVDYFFPGVRKSINGPDLKFAEDDNPGVIHSPHGFQVIERLVYSKTDSLNYDELGDETQALIATFRSIESQPELSFKLRNEYVFDAMKSAVIRLISLGITGFDSPIALNSIGESAAVLTGLKEICTAYNEEDCIRIADNAARFISASKDFNSFDRLGFIKEYADPLYRAIVKASVASGYLLPPERRPLNQLSESVFSDSLFNIDFFSPNERYRMTPARIALGRSLFYDSIFSLTIKRNCASCHDPSKAFTDGRTVPASVNASALKRNTPTLLGAAVQTKFFYDSRASTLENQLNSVVHNIDEMNGSLQEGIARIKTHPEYNDAFKKIYPGDDQPVTEYNIANAISSYVRSLSTFNTKFDRYMRGQATLTSAEKKGFNLFAGKAKCATCHYIPLFNGLVPPQFTETESEVLGVPASTRPDSPVDDDPGKYNFTKSEINLHAFKTPTLRNITLTAPYMHNGVFKTLREVMDFYNKGGGSGLHIPLDNQTLPPEELKLSKKEISSIIAFLGTLQDVGRK